MLNSSRNSKGKVKKDPNYSLLQYHIMLCMRLRNTGGRVIRSAHVRSLGSSTSAHESRVLSSRRGALVFAGALCGAAVSAAVYYRQTFAAHCEAPVERYVCEPVTPGLETKAAGPSATMRERMEDMVTKQQAVIVRALEEVEGRKFTVDKWHRKEGGGGITTILQDGKVFEKAGVNVSVVHGELPPAAVAQMRARGKDFDSNGGNVQFFATGVSLVIHGRNPNVPTFHANYRYFEIPDPNNPEKPLLWWFGGGADLTPMYLEEEDAKHFHSTLKTACDKHDPSYYPKFKKWCDEYFYLKHRGEARGVGGIFFDDLDDRSPDELFAFSSECAAAIVPAYLPIVLRNKDRKFTKKQHEWQQIRRGRYAEFNLVWDRGTKFGLHTPAARIESILMSLPLTARWEYMYEVEKGSLEEELQEVLKNPREWA
eukprot:CFRG3702T1